MIVIFTLDQASPGPETRCLLLVKRKLSTNSPHMRRFRVLARAYPVHLHLHQSLGLLWPLVLMRHQGSIRRRVQDTALVGNRLHRCLGHLICRRWGLRLR